MTLKFITFFAFIAVAKTVPIEYDQHSYQEASVLLKHPVETPQQFYHQGEEENHGPVEYQFNYSVNDDHTGDIKSHEESRHGDQVQGSYTLIDADGYKRTVKYNADKHNGFNAVVHREPIQGYQAPEQQHQTHQAYAPVTKYVTVAAPAGHYENQEYHNQQSSEYQH